MRFWKWRKAESGSEIEKFLAESNVFGGRQKTESGKNAKNQKAE